MTDDRGRQLTEVNDTLEASYATLKGLMARLRDSLSENRTMAAGRSARRYRTSPAPSSA